jgi:ABC-type transport system involved in multi-copper enzyme maturation permease subunit
MQAFLAILRYDFGQLTRSWISRIWVPLLVAPAFALVFIANNESELASETMAFYIWAVMAPISALAVAILSSGAISGESTIISDSILSRSVTRTEYVAAKIISRVGFTLAVYVIVVIPFAYLVIRYASADTSTGGVIIGLLMIAVMLVFLATFGIAMSVAMTSVLPAVLVVLLAVVLSGAVLQFLGLTWMSTTAVIDQLPETFRGNTEAWEQMRVLLVFTGLSLVALASSVLLFRRKDL